MDPASPPAGVPFVYADRVNAVLTDLTQFMQTYFISDVHLGMGTREEERTKEDRLLAFFSKILPRTRQLYIVGDLFDFWFEYRTVIPKGFHRTLSALQAFTEKGIPIHYLAGNHDFWMKDFFAGELGMTLHADPFETMIDRKRVYLHHGDGLAQKDVGYRLIRISLTVLTRSSLAALSSSSAFFSSSLLGSTRPSLVTDTSLWSSTP